MMKTVVGRMMGGLAAMSLSMVTWGANLNLDGMLMVRGMSITGARVIILTAEETPRVLTENLDHFTLRLELGTTYLLSFERPGCVSKQLRFNTWVPTGYPVGEGFYFPFQVTLEPLPEGQHFTYAGPVGSIHFDKYINAFGYEQDYRIVRDEMLTDRLEMAHADLKWNAVKELGPVNGHTSWTSAGTLGKTPVNPRSPYEVIAPTVSRTAPLVHVLAVPGERSAPVLVHVDPLHVVLDELRPGTPQPELMAARPSPRKPELQAPALMPFRRWKDVQADRLHVITTVMVLEEGREVPYRRVVSYYGGTTYFRDGLPCSKMIYQLGVEH